MNRKFVLSSPQNGSRFEDMGVFGFDFYAKA